MTILLPYIDSTRHFPAIAALYDAKAAEYNAQVAIARDSGDYSRNLLKSAHRELWFDFIRATKGEFAKSLLIFKDTPSLLEKEAISAVILMTNRKRLSGRTKKSEATIYRLTERLIDAGIISDKINHGTQHDYELHLNHEMVPISDYKNEGYDPLLEILKNSIDTTIQETLRSICTPCSSNMNIYNNKIITENFQEHDKVSAALTSNNEQTRTLHWNTGDPQNRIDALLVPHLVKINTSANNKGMLNAFGVAIPVQNDVKINTSEDYGRKIEALRQKEEERTRRYAIMLVEFVISVLFPERMIYKSERDKAYKYSEFYFAKYNTSIDCARAMKFYRERVRIVQRYLERNKAYNFSNIWPAAYMNPENYTSGFIMTQKWLKKHLEYKELQFKTRKLKSEQEMLSYALKRLQEKWTNIYSFNYWRSYVINKAPTKINEYEIAAKAMLQMGNITPQKGKKVASNVN